MGRFLVLFGLLALVGSVRASWYWPFGSDEDDQHPLRISELMRPATELIDDAADLAADGKIDESVAQYRRALAELDRIERENPDRAAGAEFATLRNKRAYVNAAIDSMLLSQVKANARAVAVSDTTELEKKLAAERGGKGNPDTARPSDLKNSAKKPSRPPKPSKPLTKREQAMQAIATGDFATAERVIGELLKEKPNGAGALNLKAAMEARQGKFKEAEGTLDQAIMSNPRSHFAYYNMAKLMLQIAPDGKGVARRYYETGRVMGGPADESLEDALK